MSTTNPRTTEQRSAALPERSGDAHAEAQAAFFAQQDVQSRDRVAFFDPMAEEPLVVVFPGVDHNEIMNVPDVIRQEIDLNRWYEGRFRVRGLVNHVDDGGSAGPEGVPVLEYRDCKLSDFDTVYVETNPERWT